MATKKQSLYEVAGTVLGGAEKYESEWRDKVGKNDTSQGAVPWEALDTLITPSVAPPDSFTVADLRERYNLSECRAYKLISKLIREGKVKRVGKFSYFNRYVMVK